MNNTLNAQVAQSSDLKRGRGRPKGSNSFAMVQIKQLLTMLSEEAVVPVSQIWLRDTLGLMVVTPTVKTIINHQVEEEQTEERVQFAIETFAN